MRFRAISYQQSPRSKLNKVRLTQIETQMLNDIFNKVTSGIDPPPPDTNTRSEHCLRRDTTKMNEGRTADRDFACPWPLQHHACVDDWTVELRT